jgi:hypothetical protein
MALIEQLFATEGGRIGVAATVLVALVLGVVALVVAGANRRLLRRVFVAAEGQEFSTHLQDIVAVYENHAAMEREIRAACAALENKSRDFFDVVDIERYDAFPGQAGHQSFSLLLLNRNGSGVILTSLISTQSGRVYAKSIKAWISESALSHEEEALLKRHARS